MPPAPAFVRSGIIRSNTIIRPKYDLSWPATSPKLRAAVLLLFVFVFGSFLPQRGWLTVNTLPYSNFAVDVLGGEFQFDTPEREIPVPAGKVKVYFVVPSQNNRYIVREIQVLPQQNAKLFEDFREY